MKAIKIIAIISIATTLLSLAAVIYGFARRNNVYYGLPYVCLFKTEGKITAEKVVFHRDNTIDIYYTNGEKTIKEIYIKEGQAYSDKDYSNAVANVYSFEFIMINTPNEYKIDQSCYCFSARNIFRIFAIMTCVGFVSTIICTILFIIKAKSN